MGLQGALAVVAVMVALALAVVGLVLAFSQATSHQPRSAVLAAMTRAQRRRAAHLVRRGGPVAGGELAGARALATVQAGQWYLALPGACGVALAAGALVSPWSLDSPLGWWVPALFAAGLVMQAVGALVFLAGVRRARRFLAAHPDPGAAAVTW